MPGYRKWERLRAWLLSAPHYARAADAETAADLAEKHGSDGSQNARAEMFMWRAASRFGLLAIGGEPEQDDLSRDQAGNASDALTHLLFKALHVLTMTLLLLSLLGAQF